MSKLLGKTLLSFNIKLILGVLVSVIFTLNASAQSTTDQLARRIFDSFKNNDVAKLDTLIPTFGQIFEILKEKGLDVSTVKSKKNSDEIYEHHLTKFQDKCSNFINDTTYFKVDWINSTFDTSIAKNSEINLTLDSPQHSKKVIMFSLDISFTDKKSNFVISFKDIYNYNGVWKIGDNIKFRRLEY